MKGTGVWITQEPLKGISVAKDFFCTYLYSLIRVNLRLLAHPSAQYVDIPVKKWIRCPSKTNQILCFWADLPWIVKEKSEKVNQIHLWTLGVWHSNKLSKGKEEEDTCSVSSIAFAKALT